MNRSARFVGFALALASACGEPPSPGPSPSASASPSPSPSPSPSSATPASSASSAVGRAPPARRLERKTTPLARFTKDRELCDGGDRSACRRVANRYSATGADAACGVPRSRQYPSLKRVPSDVEGDELEYARAIQRACTLSEPGADDDACALARVAAQTLGGSLETRLSATRRDPKELGIWAFRTRIAPPAAEPGMPRRDDAKKLAERRKSCLEDIESCSVPDSTLFRQPQAPKDGKLASDIAALAAEVCEQTHDCDDIYVALDKAGYSPAELAPLRAAFAKTLTGACLEGECTCSDALKYLPREDADRIDLAILGCENGEADGCAALAAAYDAGAGVEKDPLVAEQLYELTCPAIRPAFGVGEYSRAACDHFAELYAGGPYPGKDRERGTYYARAACRHSGYEFDHAPCVRLGVLWATKRTVTYSDGMNRRNAIEAANGRGADFNHECDRPSVAAECKAFEDALRFAK